jgi:4-amino-4-deoxy-L-arabinose transferase-like glycosyltransferase
MSRFSLAPLWAAFALYFCLTLALIRVVPFNSAPDEGAHADYIGAIASSHALPVFAGQAPPAFGNEFHQPPLFYLLATPLWAVAGSGGQVPLVRALSLLFGLLTIWVVWQAAQLVFGRQSRAPAFCALGAALSPLHQGIGASINNDGLAGLWAACLFYLVARAWLEGRSRRVVVLVGAVAGLGVLTKLTVLPLGVWAFVCLGLALRKQGLQPVRALLPALAIALLLVAPMMGRNQILYGDPFAYRLFSRAATDVSPGLALFSQIIGAGGYARGMALQMVGTAFGFWGGSSSFAKVVGTFSPSGPHFSSPLWSLPLLLVVFIPMFGLWSAWKTRGLPNEEENSNRRALSLCWTVGALLVGLLWLNFALAHVAGGQARYLHAALLPLTLLVGGGLSKAGRAGTVAAGVLALVMLGMSLANIFVWKTLV